MSFYLYKVPRAVKLIETDSRMEFAGGWKRNGNLVFNIYRVSVGVDGKVPETDG